MVYICRIEASLHFRGWIVICANIDFLVSGPGRSQFLHRKTQISLKVTRWNRVGSF